MHAPDERVAKSAAFGPSDGQPKPCVICCPAPVLERLSLDPLNTDLRRIGLEFIAASGPVPDQLRSLLPALIDGGDPAEGLLLVYYSYMAAPGRDVVSAPNSNLIRKISAILRRHRVRGLLLGDEAIGRLAQGWPDLAALVFRAGEGDRDLALRPGEEFVRNLSQNRLRSTVWLVRRGGQFQVRKAFSARYASHFQNELAARTIIQDDRIVPIDDTSGTVLYLPFLADHVSWGGGIFSFFPRQRALEIFDLIAAINRRGYSIVDINPDAFLWKNGKVKAIDMEFFSRTRIAGRLEASADFTGAFHGIDSPQKGGYDRHWRDALGAPYHVVAGGSHTAIWVWRLQHVIAYRLPRQLGLFAERTVRKALDLAAYVWRVCQTGIRVG